MSLFESAMKSHGVLENDPYDWEKCDSEDMLTIGGAATTKQLTRLTPAYMGYLQPRPALTVPALASERSAHCCGPHSPSSGSLLTINSTATFFLGFF